MTLKGQSGAAGGPEIPLGEAAIEEFRARLHGKLLRPGDVAYERARAIWNAEVRGKPLLIARCTGTADVIECVNLARDHGLRLAVRSGGHNIAGHALCAAGLVVDLSRMRGIHVNPAMGTARVQPGVTWGELDRETQVFGLATPGNMLSTTGVAGTTLGGGFGWLSRRYGTAVDNLLSIEVVTADGGCVTASESEHADLFRAMRGGGNCGVATSFEFRLHPVGPTVLAGIVLYPMEQARDVLRFYREYSGAAPDELGLLAVLAVAPAVPSLPEHVHGRPVVSIACCYTGSLAQGERALRPIKELGNPLVDLIALKSYVAHQELFDDMNPPGRRHYWKSDYLTGLSDAAIETAISYASRFSSPLSTVRLVRLGGALARGGDRSTAAAYHEAQFLWSIESTWLEPRESERHVRWTRAFAAAMRPFGAGRAQANVMSADEARRSPCTQ